MSDAADAGMSVLAKQLEQRDALEDRLIDVLRKGGEAQAKLHAVEERLGRIGREVLRLEETGPLTLLPDSVGGRRASELNVKRELRDGAMAELAECEGVAVSLREQAENLQREVRGYEQIEAEYEALAREKLRRLAESDPETAKRIAELRAEVATARGNHEMLAHAMDDGAEAQRMLGILARSLIGMGKEPPKVRSRGMTGFMLGGPILGVVLAATAAKKKLSRKRKIIGPVEDVRTALDRLGDTLGRVHWDPRLAVDSAIHDIMGELTTTHLGMTGGVATSAADKPAIAVHLGGLVDGLMRQLCQKKAQERSQLRTLSRDRRSLLASTPTPQAA